MSIHLRLALASGALVPVVFAACSRESQASVETSAARESGAVSPAARVEVVVYAAASTRDALQALEPVFEHRHAVDLVFNFGSSGDLAKQILAANKADVFLSAGETEMDQVEAAQLVVAGTRENLLSNQLVVVEPADATSPFTEPFTAQQLGGGAVKHLALANTETVPAGRYARAWLDQLGAWNAVESKVVPAVDVRAALAAVESGACEAGIVYRSDATAAKHVRIAHAVPPAEAPRIVYPLAVLAGRPHERDATAFADFLTSGEALSVFTRHGFLDAVSAPAPAKVGEPAAAPR